MDSKVSSAIISFLLLSFLMTSSVEGASGPEVTGTCPTGVADKVKGACQGGLLSGVGGGLLGGLLPGLGSDCCTLLRGLGGEEPIICLCLALGDILSPVEGLLSTLLGGCGLNPDGRSITCIKV